MLTFLKKFKYTIFPCFPIYWYKIYLKTVDNFMAFILRLTNMLYSNIFLISGLQSTVRIIKKIIISIRFYVKIYNCWLNEFNDCFISDNFNPCVLINFNWVFSKFYFNLTRKFYVNEIFFHVKKTFRYLLAEWYWREELPNFHFGNGGITRNWSKLFIIFFANSMKY